MRLCKSCNIPGLPINTRGRIQSQMFDLILVMNLMLLSVGACRILQDLISTNAPVGSTANLTATKEKWSKHFQLSRWCPRPQRDSPPQFSQSATLTEWVFLGVSCFNSVHYCGTNPHLRVYRIPKHSPSLVPQSILAYEAQTPHRF